MRPRLIDDGGRKLPRLGFPILLEASLCALIVLTPLFFGSVHPWAKGLAVAAVFSVIGIWSLRTLRKGGFSYVKTPLVYFIPASVCFFALQLAPFPARLAEAISPGLGVMREAAGLEGGWTRLALYPWAASGQAALLLSALGLFFLAVNHIRSKEAVVRIVCVSLGTGALLALLAIMRNRTAETQSFLPFVNKNQFAGYMLAPIAMAASLLFFRVAGRSRKTDLDGGVFRAFSGPGAARAVVLAFVVVLMSSALLLTGSRGGMTGLAFSFLTICALAARSKRQALLLLGAGAAAFAASLHLAANSYVLTRIGTLMDESLMRPLLFRYHIWKDTAGMAASFPLAGTGLGGFETAFPFYKTMKMECNVFQPENDYLYTLSEGGILGFALAAGFCLAWAARATHGARRGRDAYKKGVSAGAVSGLAGLLMHGLTETNLHVPATMLLVTVLMALGYLCAVDGLLDGKTKKDGGPLKMVMVPPGGGLRLLMMTGLALSVLVAGYSVKVAAADLVYRSALYDEAGLSGKKGWSPRDHESALAKLALSSRLDSRRAAYPFEMGRIYALLAEYARAAEAMGAARPGQAAPKEYFDKGLGCFERSLKCNPYSSFARFMTARMLERGGLDAARSEREYLAADRLNPTSPFISKGVAAWFTAKGDAVTAGKYNARLPGLDPRYNSIRDVSLTHGGEKDSAFAGERISWSSAARVGSGELEYKFQLLAPGAGQWRDMTDFSRGGAWTWDTSGMSEGEYRIRVIVRVAADDAFGREFESPAEKAYLRPEPYLLKKMDAGA